LITLEHVEIESRPAFAQDVSADLVHYTFDTKRVLSGKKIYGSKLPCFKILIDKILKTRNGRSFFASGVSHESP